MGRGVKGNIIALNSVEEKTTTTKTHHTQFTHNKMYEKKTIHRFDLRIYKNRTSIMRREFDYKMLKLKRISSANIGRTIKKLS